MIVPDASVMVEILQRTPTGKALAPRLADAELVAPELLFVEVASVLRRSLLRSDMTLQDVRNALGELVAWPISRVVDADLVTHSVAWWRNVTAYDAMYLTVAAMFDATVISVDGPLSRAPVTDIIIENVRIGP